MTDTAGTIVPLGEEVGVGGEGRVYTVPNRPGVAAKIYHKSALDEDHALKLRTMVKLASDDMATIAAWPRDLLLDSRNHKPRGVLMPLISDSRALHELYGTTNRARHYPHAQWGHLVLAARNTAAAFATMHKNGVVVGDVNQGNLLVDQEMRVRFIDCDSFQIRLRNHTFHCPVGTPHFTPPELQSLKLRDVTRTPDHDRFGLAVLIFHLLFVGRHPFAGRFFGDGEMTIERAIGERRFAFSPNREQTQVDPPPASLLLDDLTGPLGALFERAFRKNGEEERPHPEEWAPELENLLRRRRVCEIDSSHVYLDGLMECPWCRIEDAGGPSFFLVAVAGVGGGASAEARLATLDAQVARIGDIHFPDLAGRLLNLPTLPPIKDLKEKAKLGGADYLAVLGAVAAVVCLGGVFYWPALLVGGAGTVGAALALLFGAWGKSRRDHLAEFDNKLDEQLHRIANAAYQVEQAHNQRKAEYDTYNAVVSTGRNRYEADTEDLNTILKEIREEQKEEFLQGYLIRDYRRKIAGMTPAIVVGLESFNIETAADVDQHLLTGLPYLDQELIMELIAWRKKIEQNFQFKTEDGVTERELHANRQEAERLFKISQARKLIAGAKRLRAIVHAARGKLDKDLAAFRRLTDKWRDVARDRQAFQAGRSWLERHVNSTTAALWTLAAAPPLVCALFWFFFR